MYTLSGYTHSSQLWVLHRLSIAKGTIRVHPTQPPSRLHATLQLRSTASRMKYMDIWEDKLTRFLSRPMGALFGQPSSIIACTGPGDRLLGHDRHRTLSQAIPLHQFTRAGALNVSPFDYSHDRAPHHLPNHFGLKMKRPNQ